MIINIENLTKNYKNGKGVFDISFAINSEDITAFIGNNGAGKTTTIKAIFNELKIEEGNILINKENIFLNNNLRKIAFFPDSNNIPMDITAKEYIDYICLVNNLNLKNIKDKYSSIINFLNFEQYLKVKISKLSAGWKKKLILASVLIREPQFILLDEPTANLDINAKKEFIEIIKEIHKKGVGILITSHIIEELQEIATNLILIEDGKILYDNKLNKGEMIIDIYNKYASLERKNQSIDFFYGDKNEK